MIDGIFIHPDYTLGREHDNDIALIKLKGNLEFRRQVSPVCLPETGTANGSMCVTTGWKHDHGKYVRSQTVVYLSLGIQMPVMDYVYLLQC